MAQTDMGGARPPALWDRVVRVSHWGIVIVILANEVVHQGRQPGACLVWLGGFGSCW